jgi:hypothetical protein
MKTTHAELTFSQVLVSWLTHRITQAATVVKPAYRADQIAALVAASNNPSGT